jgi:hypothetical protein
LTTFYHIPRNLSTQNQNSDLTHEEEHFMSFETKVILRALADMLLTADTVEEAYMRLAKIANAEGVILEKYEVEKKAHKPEKS